MMISINFIIKKLSTELYLIPLSFVKGKRKQYSTYKAILYVQDYWLYLVSYNLFPFVCPVFVRNITDINQKEHILV